MVRFERPEFDRAGEILAEAVAQNSERGDAFSWYSFWQVLACLQNWAEDPVQTGARALWLAERGQTLDPLDARALAFHGMVRGLVFRQPLEALTLYDRSRQLNPNIPATWTLAGLAHAGLGNLDEAERCLAESERLAPLHPIAFLSDAACLYIALSRRDFAAAVRRGRTLTEVYPRFIGPYVSYIAALGHLGHSAEAVRLLARVRSLEPAFGIAWATGCGPSHNQELHELVTEGLRLAGAPE
jgi:tetratricopeptide (TPR) repeat protein